MAHSNTEPSQAGPLAADGPDAVAVRAVPFDRPWEWLASGWRDLWTEPSISLAYGLLATLVGLGLTFGLWNVELESLIPVLAGGFLLIGPLLAVGLYEKSRTLLAGGQPSLEASISAGWQSIPRFGLLAAVLLFLYFAWVRIALLLLALFLGTNGLPPAQEFMATLLFSAHGLGLLVFGTAAGAILATIAFAITAVSIPLLLDRRMDAITAIVTSVEAVSKNPKPMALWAALIAGFIVLGMVTFGIGLIIAFPLLGHATWHAYRDLIAPR